MATRPLRMLLRALCAAWLLFVLLACCTSRMVTQSSLVPFAEPPPPPSSHGTGDIAASASGLTYVEPTDAERGLGHYVPAAQLNLAGMLRPIDGLTIRPLGMLAFSGGASPIGTNLLPPPSAPSFGLGVDVGYTFGDESDPLLARIHGGALALGVATMISDPAGSTPFDELGWMGVVEGGLDLGYWVTSWLLLIASVDVRNSPTVPASIAACIGSSGPFVGFGDIAVTPRVSAEIEVERGFGIFAGVAVPAVGSPFASYPIVSVGARASFGDATQGFRRSPPPVLESTPAEEEADEARLAR